MITTTFKYDWRSRELYCYLPTGEEVLRLRSVDGFDKATAIHTSIQHAYKRGAAAAREEISQLIRKHTDCENGKGR